MIGVGEEEGDMLREGGKVGRESTCWVEGEVGERKKGEREGG